MPSSTQPRRHLAARDPLRRQHDRLHSRLALDETTSQHKKQEFYNAENNIEPRTIIRSINDSLAPSLPHAERLIFNTQQI